MATREKIITGTSNTTTYISQFRWKGLLLSLQGDDDNIMYCEHKVEVVHHYDDEGNHYCPTMFLMCLKCGGLANEPEPYECEKWGEK